MAGAGGEKRRRRCVMATDTEWSRMQERAVADGHKSCSEFIVRRCLDEPDPTPPEPALAAPVLRRVARLVLALEELERLRLNKESLGVEWDALLADADRWLDGEAALG